MSSSRNIHFVRFHVQLHGIRVFFLIHNLVDYPENPFNFLSLQFTATFLTLFDFLVFFLDFAGCTSVNIRLRGRWGYTRSNGPGLTRHRAHGSNLDFFVLFGEFST